MHDITLVSERYIQCKITSLVAIFMIFLCTDKVVGCSLADAKWKFGSAEVGKVTVSLSSFFLMFYTSFTKSAMIFLVV